MYLKIWVEWAADHFGLVIMYSKSIHFSEDKCARKNDFYIFVLSDLNLWPIDLKLALLHRVREKTAP